MVNNVRQNERGTSKGSDTRNRKVINMVQIWSVHVKIKSRVQEESRMNVLTTFPPVLPGYLSEEPLTVEAEVEGFLEILVEVLDERLTKRKEVSAIVEECGDNWMTPIIKFLKEALWPKDMNEARSMHMKINHYAMEDEVMFKKSYMVPML
nr:reverse transcriptase domain-containing protein [Tanacetum cinerariifolium]